MSYTDILGYIAVTSLVALVVAICVAGILIIAVKIYDWFMN